MNFQTNEMGRNEYANWRTCLVVFLRFFDFAYRHNTLINSIDIKKKQEKQKICFHSNGTHNRHSRNLDHFRSEKTSLIEIRYAPWFRWHPDYQTSAFISKRKTYFYPQHLRPLIEHKISSINSKIKAC